mgnify:CR=1 FL=1
MDLFIFNKFVSMRKNGVKHHHITQVLTFIITRQVKLLFHKIEKCSLVFNLNLSVFKAFFSTLKHEHLKHSSVH